jgi:hypothetical protein
MQYVGASVIAMDGHAIVHHAYTNSDADAKRTVFAGILFLPRLWRIPAETLRRFAHFLTGHLLRWAFLFSIEIITKSPRPFIKQVQFVGVRLLMIAELLWAIYTGYTLMFFA